VRTSTTFVRFVRRAAPWAHTVRIMPIAITDDHLALTDTVADLLQRRDARSATRALLEADTETLPPFWAEVAELGWLGLHLPEAHGGSGYGLPELVVVVEEFGANVAPGPFVPTVVASATIAVAAGTGPAAARPGRRLAHRGHRARGLHHPQRFHGRRLGHRVGRRARRSAGAGIGRRRGARRPH
jgi:alkylation response protein AidB-like acyl-CoA dehydrogenase